MKKVVEYKDADGHCDVGDVVFLRADLTEKAVLIAVHKSRYCDVYIFKPLADNSIFMTDENGNIPFCGMPYIFAKEIELKEDEK